MTFLINTLLGFLIAQISDILRRDKESTASPLKFNIWFFLKDTWQKILLSLMLSCAISALVWMNAGDFTKVLGEQWALAGNLVYAFIGFMPEIALQVLKKKYGFTQPKVVEGYSRKE